MYKIQEKIKWIYAKKVLLKEANGNYSSQSLNKQEEYIFGLFTYISHPGIEKFYEIYEDIETLYIIQEYSPEGSLKGYFEANQCTLHPSVVIDILN